MARGGHEDCDPEDERSGLAHLVFVVKRAAANFALSVGNAMKGAGDSALETPDSAQTVENIRGDVVGESVKAVDKEVNPARVDEVIEKMRPVAEGLYLSKFRPQKNPDGTFAPQTKAAALAILAAARSTLTGKEDLKVYELGGELHGFDSAELGHFSVRYYGENRDCPTVHLSKCHGSVEETVRLDKRGNAFMHMQRSNLGQGRVQQFADYNSGSYRSFHLKQEGEHPSQSTECELLVAGGKVIMTREFKDGIMHEVCFIDEAASEAHRRGDFDDAHWRPNEATDHFGISDTLRTKELDVDMKRQQEAKDKKLAEAFHREGVDYIVDEEKVEATEREILQNPTFLDKLKRIEFENDRLTSESQDQLKEVLFQALGYKPEQLELDYEISRGEHDVNSVFILVKDRKDKFAASVRIEKRTGNLLINIGSVTFASAERPYAEGLARDAAGNVNYHSQSRWQNGESVRFARGKYHLGLKTFRGKKVFNGKEVRYENEKPLYAIIKDASGKIEFVDFDKIDWGIFADRILKQRLNDFNSS